MTRDLDQAIAEAENRVQRLKAKKRTKDTRRKIILGAIIMQRAYERPEVARTVVSLLEEYVTRPVDKKDIEPLLRDLRAIIEEAKS
jgi:hypothetical protein